MSNIKKIAAIVSVIAIVVLIYTISTFRSRDIPTSVSPSGSLNTTTGYDTQKISSTQTETKSVTSYKATSVSPVTTVPDEIVIGENKAHIIVPYSKEAVKAPPERIDPVPVVTPAHIVFESIPLICHDTQPPEQTEENDPYEEVLPQTESTVIYTEPPVTDSFTDTSVITPSVETPDQTKPNIINE